MVAREIAGGVGKAMNGRAVMLRVQRRALTLARLRSAGSQLPTAKRNVSLTQRSALPFGWPASAF